MRKTKIVATIGPASSEVNILKEMFRSGLSAVRVNTAHVASGQIKRVKKRIDALNKELGTHVGTMVDLKGPELRTGVFPGGKFQVRKGGKYRISYEERGADILISAGNVFDAVKESDILMMSDGMVRFKILEKDSSSATLISLNSGELRDRSRVNIPGRLLDLGTVTDRDIEFIDEGVETGVEFFALSFVQTSRNVEELQKMIMERDGESEIVSKIETKNGLQGIRDIAKRSGYVMVARGDLGVELPLREVSLAQKRIISVSHGEGVPTIVATQILESMVNNSSPTRAEVSDVTNAILDDTDALMLSEETAIGKYPIEAVRYLSDISEFVESHAKEALEPRSFSGNRVAYSISMASKVIAAEIDADGILVFTKSGNTARMVSAVRPQVPIYAVVTSSALARKLNLLRGVKPIVVPSRLSRTNDQLGLIEYISELGTFDKNSRLVVTSGAPYFLFGGTNDVRIVTVGKFCGRGYPSGKSVAGRATKEINGKGEILFALSTRPDIKSVTRKFKGVVFGVSIPLETREELVAAGLTVLTSASMVVDLEEGELVSIDGETGVITR